MIVVFGVRTILKKVSILSKNKTPLSFIVEDIKGSRNEIKAEAIIIDDNGKFRFINESISKHQILLKYPFSKLTLLKQEVGWVGGKRKETEVMYEMIEGEENLEIRITNV
jgi:hypothetical protein